MMMEEQPREKASLSAEASGTLRILEWRKGMAVFPAVRPPFKKGVREKLVI